MTSLLTDYEIDAATYEDFWSTRGTMEAEDTSQEDLEPTTSRTAEMTRSSNAREQLKQASDLGRAAFARGIICAPCQDRECMAMLKGRAVGRTPDGEAPTVDILVAWRTGWSRANLAAPVGG